MNTADQIRGLLQNLLRLVPEYWPNTSYTMNVILDFDDGVVRKHKHAIDGDFEALMGLDIDEAMGEELSSEEYEEYSAEILSLMKVLSESIAKAYKHAKPKEDGSHLDESDVLEGRIGSGQHRRDVRVELSDRKATVVFPAEDAPSEGVAVIVAEKGLLQIIGKGEFTAVAVERPREQSAIKNAIREVSPN
jgi:hypothetical protein